MITPAQLAHITALSISDLSEAMANGGYEMEVYSSAEFAGVFVSGAGKMMFVYRCKYLDLDGIPDTCNICISYEDDMLVGEY